MERATDAEAVEASEVVQETTEEQTVAVNAVYTAVDDTAKELAVKANDDPVTDEFCSNAENDENILSYENSVCYRFIAKEMKDIGVFKRKVIQWFLTAEVAIFNQLFGISGYKNLQYQLKFYLKIKMMRRLLKQL